MRRRAFAALVLACSTVSVLAACSTPPGTDGQLLDDWVPLAEPKVSVPVAGQCFTTTASNAFRLEASSFTAANSCIVDHAVELAHVGEITGADANADAVPDPNSAAAKAAYAACASAVQEFLGDAWQTGRVHLLVQFPTDKQWDGGARFYRCDLAEIADESGKVVIRKESLRDGLRGDKALGLSCVNDFGENDESVDGIDFVACTAKHTAEFSGVFTVTPANRAYPGDDQLGEIVLDGCEQLAAKYLGLPNTNIPEGLGWFSLGTTEEDWGQGNQSVRCYVGVFDRKRPIRGGATIKGLGNKPIPR
jgi:hypothetical protein